MPKPISTMLNFRVKEDFGARLDAAAEALALTRSDFIRQAVEEKVASLAGIIPDTPRPRLTPPRVAKGPTGKDQTKCPHVNKVRLPTGIKLCQDCGGKLR